MCQKYILLKDFKNEACDYVEAQKIIHKGMEEEGLSYEEAMSNVPVSSSFFQNRDDN